MLLLYCVGNKIDILEPLDTGAIEAIVNPNELVVRSIVNWYDEVTPIVVEFGTKSIQAISTAK